MVSSGLTALPSYRLLRELNNNYSIYDGVNAYTRLKKQDVVLGYVVIGRRRLTAKKRE